MKIIGAIVRYLNWNKKYFDADTSYTGKVSDNKGINAIVLANVVEGLFIIETMKKSL